MAKRLVDKDTGKELDFSIPEDQKSRIDEVPRVLVWEGWITVPRDDLEIFKRIEGIKVLGEIRESDLACKSYTIQVTEERAWDKLDKHWGRWIWGPKR